MVGRNKIQFFLGVFLLALAVTVPPAIAQIEVQILDQNSRPIEGATITSESLNSSENDFTVTDYEGKGELLVKTPAKIIVRHLSFLTQQDTLNTKGEHLIHLIPSSEYLDEIVVTGQYQAQSAKKSVYKVRTITTSDISMQGSNSVVDVISNELNIRFNRDNALGTSGISLQGLSGQNVKVLLDGVPMIGRSGTSNEIDLNQINIGSVERIEIIEGPQSVNYGADALAGVINIITKKDVLGNMDIYGGFQEETIGREYSFFEDGSHNVHLGIRTRINENYFIQSEVRSNSFGGWTGSGEGRNKQWYPKDQLFANGLIRFEKGNHNIYYRLDYLKETITNKGLINDNNPLKDPFGIDEDYTTNRFDHQLQADYSIGSLAGNGALSFSSYNRVIRQYSTNLFTGDESITTASEQDTTVYKKLFYRTTLSSPPKVNSGKFSFSAQFGVDGGIEFASGSRIENIDKPFYDLGVFASSELVFGKLSLRPGIRITYNSAFASTPTPSINGKLKINGNTNFRFGYGRGYRAPSVRELYFEFIDASHNILGNKNLQPENSHNVNADISHEISKSKISLNAGGFYNYIDNRITYLFPEDLNSPTTFVNLLKYKTSGLNTSFNYKPGQWNINAGFSYIGQFQQLTELTTSGVPEFTFTPSVNSRIQYDLLGHDIKFAAFYKFSGPAKEYQLTTDIEGNDLAQLTRLQGYSMLDFTVTKIWNKKITIQLGVKNALDVSSINSSLPGTHNSSTGQASVAYGRSYFAQMKFQISKN